MTKLKEDSIKQKLFYGQGAELDKKKDTLLSDFSQEKGIKLLKELATVRSITPETHTSRKYEVPTNVSNDEEAIAKSPYFIDEYHHAPNKIAPVLRFGINVYNQDVLDEVAKYNQTPVTTPSLTSKGANETSQEKLKSLKASNPLTCYEKINAKKAIEFLESKKTNTVLLDVFIRGVDGKIDTSDDKEFFHTAVLYRVKDKYLLIDPSNVNFSSSLTCVNDKIAPLSTSKPQIYKGRKENTGPESNQYRDCVDVAVKLAMNLEENLKLGLIDIIPDEDGTFISSESLKNSISIKEITNQNTTYKLLPAKLESCALRAKQSSDIREEKKVTVLLKSINEIDKLVSTQKIFDKTDSYHAKALYAKKVEEFYTVNSGIESLLKIHSEIFQSLQNMEPNNTCSLIGEEMKAIDYFMDSMQC